MALKYEIDSLEGLDASLHGEYEKTDGGKYRLKVEGLDNADGLKSALQKERESNKEAKAQLSELQKARDEAEKKAMEEQGKYKELSEKERQEKIQAQSKYEELQRKVNEKTRDLMVRDLASSMTTDPVEIDIIVKFGADYVQIDGDEVKFNKSTDEIKAEMSRFIRSKASGSGDKGGKSGGAVKDADYFDKNSPSYNLTEQGRIFRENPTLYNQLKKG